MRKLDWTHGLLSLCLVLGAGCGDDSKGNDNFGEGTGGDDGGTGAGDDGSGDAGDDGTGDGGTTTDDGGGGPKLDVGDMPDIPPDDPGDDNCKVVDDMDAIGECDEEAPPDSFEPDVQWTWGGTSKSVIVTPLVANLTEDNDDGEIDLCDIPDVVVVSSYGLAGRIVVLDGATGSEHFTISNPVDMNTTPALGDIDNDGLPEIVAATSGQRKLIAFEHDGTHKWTGDTTYQTAQGGSIAIADLDNDGSPEIIVDEMVAGADGVTKWVAPAQVGWMFMQENGTPTAADLDDNGTLEVILGQAAYDCDGVEYYNDTTIKPGYPQVADLDDDDDPEIIVNNSDGITILEHDGTLKFQNLRPTGDPVGFGNNWYRPSTVHDFDSDDLSEFAVSSATHYSVFYRNYTVMWTAEVQDGSGWAAGTAFDFLGDGGAEAMYADEVSLFIYDVQGNVILQVPRSSATLSEYPVVADIDDDGSSEIVVVSSTPFEDQGPQTSPAVQVIRDVQDRWIQARRIWNQHTYHVTNVREDGTIPQFERPHWKMLNTFRTNAQIEDGSVCDPPPEG